MGADSMLRNMSRKRNNASHSEQWQRWGGEEGGRYNDLRGGTLRTRTSREEGVG